MCRVDFTKNKHTLKKLCKNFYSHIVKRAYFDISGNKYDGIKNLRDVEFHFKHQIRDWWPSDPESGEPNMPNDTYFVREAKLYVDIDDYGNWTEPNPDLEAIWYKDSDGPTPLDRARKSLEKLYTTKDENLLTPESLKIFNNTMKKFIISNRTDQKNIKLKYEKISIDIENNIGIKKNKFIESALFNWPIYWINQ